MIRWRVCLRRTRYSQHTRSNRRHSRWYSSPSSPERVVLPVQSNGSINIDIHYPLNRPLGGETSSTAVLYLPRGPLLHSEEDDASTISILQSHLACPIVQVNYRLSRDERYPAPIHDVLSGYDWVLNNLLPKRAISRAGRSDHIGKIAVCGELVGGGLASMLALTECRIGEPGVIAAAISNPLVDWVSLTDPPPEPKASKRKARPESTISDAELAKHSALRAQLFARPDGYFDPFASPILFFRSAGKEVPPAPAAVPLDDMDHLSMLEREGFIQVQDDYETPETSDLASDSSNDIATTARRKVSRRFPSISLRLRLPSFHISAGIQSPTRLQTEEFTSMLRKSIVRQSKDWSEAAEFGRKVVLEDEEGYAEETSVSQLADAERKAIFELYDGLGLWNASHGGKKRIPEVAKWLKNQLE